VICYWLLP